MATPVQLDPLTPVLPFPRSDELKNSAADRLAEAVRIKTVSYDDMGPMDEDVSCFSCLVVQTWLIRCTR